MAKGPGRSHRKGISLIELAERFPTEEAALKWFEAIVWPTERTCVRQHPDGSEDALLVD